jgi:calcineurin-like phosphoesterase family protein
MNEVIINNINHYVGVNDELYHLGDFAFGAIRDVPLLRSRISCRRIYLVYGNHDRKTLVRRSGIPRKFVDGVFTWIRPYHELKYNKQKIVLCHYSMRVWNQSHYGSFHAYGHSHGNLPGFGRSMDVGVDAQDYRPILLNHFLERLRNIDPVHVDHHNNGYYQCTNCNTIEQHEKEVLCWRCGIGEMIWKGKLK